ncbi:hypothetical protein CLU79DRAFT_838164 [Phycomyces nitens]|nr:hypothetical protein CLU79DRAFT_838164 [Phycomyces nitens]
MSGKFIDTDPESYSYIVGIDFGTTFSGCSYVYSKDSTNDIFDITEWPKRNGFIYPKAPTALLYAHNSKNIIAWGYDAINKSKDSNSRGILVNNFKLLLDPSYPKHVLPNNLTVLEVITDYLCEFNKYIHTCFKSKLGAIYDVSKFRYCLTVPAIWNDQAKSTMREAAILAGIVSRNDHPDRLVLTSEPEAASLYCEKRSEQYNLIHGQRFMICDAGGGTVDLIVFEIEDFGGVKTLKEVTNGSGSSCGSTFLDENMRNIFKRRFGKHAENNKYAIDSLVDYFITSIKPHFNNEDDEFFTIPAMLNLGGGKLSDIGVVDGRTQITIDELREDVFEPVVKQVLELISDQIAQSKTKLDTIFLVGGFGQSKYLGKRVKDTFKSKVESTCVPSRGEMAVVRGAVMYGIDPNKITHRVLRRTYGLDAGSLFDASRDPPEKGYIDYDGVMRCSDRFIIYATKGESMPIDKCVTREFFIFYPNNYSLDLFAYDIDGETPRYTTDIGVRKVAEFVGKTPFLPRVKYKEKVLFTTNMYFGKTEIQIENVIQGKVFRFISAFISHELEKTTI